MPVVYTGSFTLSFKNEHTVYENEVRCLVKSSDYNLSYNPTLVTGSYLSGSIGYQLGYYFNLFNCYFLLLRKLIYLLFFIS